MSVIDRILSHLPHLTIRRKVVIGTVIPVLIFTILGVISYDYLVRLESDLGLMEKADDLRDAILEIRRYEKNYLLYSHVEDFEEAGWFIAQAYAAATEMAGLVSPGSAPGKAIARLLDVLAAYQGHLHTLRPDGRPVSPDAGELENLRQAGKDLTDVSGEVKAAARGRILYLVHTLMRQLFATGVLLVLFGTGMALFLGRKILRALDTITFATSEIGKGRFQPLNVPASGDETQHVLTAFNQMIGELRRRQDQLVQEKKLSSLGILTSGIAHQLNNPLNNISTSCQILTEEFKVCDPDFAERMLKNIRQEVLRARDIVKGLLDFSRARDFSLGNVDLHDLVAKTFNLASSQVPSGVTLVNHVPPQFFLDLDAARMQEVFINLTLNAAQAIPQPPGAITFSAATDAPSRQAVITVEDTGTGIPEAALTHVFDPFFTTKDEGQGTGLGLSVVFGIIEKHKGTITAENIDGGGARFVIRLPLPQGH